MISLNLFILSFATTFLSCISETPYFLSDAFIESINKKNTTWTAGRNFAEDVPLAYIKRLLGVIPDVEEPRLKEMRHDPDLIASLPESFDPTSKWPSCATLNTIRDQGDCGSCWAIAATSTMTDRVCTSSNGTKNFEFSTADLLTCCTRCGDGCNGTRQISFAWEYWKQSGIVSGGVFDSREGCRPYEFPPCDHVGFSSNSLAKCSGDIYTPKCKKFCEKGYNVSFEADKHYGKDVYRLDGEDQIKAELFMNGPVEASFEVYEDFINYKKGIYQHVSGQYNDSHAVKILGWGVENGVPYWKIANSWNTHWGDGGFFKFLRGKNHCKIEENVVAGIPS